MEKRYHKGFPFHVWQGYTGIWYWTLDQDRGHVVANRDISGSSRSRDEAITNARDTITSLQAHGSRVATETRLDLGGPAQSG